MQYSQKLDDIERRFDDLTRQMSDPVVISDAEGYRKLAKERSELEEVVSKYRDYKQVKRNLDDARPMIEDPEPELRQMANDEVRRLEPELARIVLLPFVLGASYELIRFAAKHQQGLMAVLSRPGLWLQRVTTKPPSDDQAAVAIHALEGAMQLEEAQGGELVIA